MSMTKEDIDRHGAALSAALSGGPTENTASAFVAAFGPFVEQIFATEQDPGQRLAKTVFAMLESMTKGFWQGIRGDGDRTDGDVVADVLTAGRDSFDAAVADLFATNDVDLDLTKEDFERRVASLSEARTEETFVAAFRPIVERIHVNSRDPGRRLATLTFVLLSGVVAGLRWGEGAQA
jgi:hypothetical protein